MNTTNEAQVFATSEAFQIADGEGLCENKPIKRGINGGFPSREFHYDCFINDCYILIFHLHPKQQNNYFFLVRGTVLGFYLRTC